MWKLRQGKVMIFNMVLIFALAIECVTLMPKYEDSGYYKFLIWFFMIGLVCVAINRVYLAWKIFKITKEMSQVSSKTEISNDPSDETV